MECENGILYVKSRDLWRLMEDDGYVRSEIKNGRKGTEGYYITPYSILDVFILGEPITQEIKQRVKDIIPDCYAEREGLEPVFIDEVFYARLDKM